MLCRHNMPSAAGRTTLCLGLRTESANILSAKYTPALPDPLSCRTRGHLLFPISSFAFSTALQDVLAACPMSNSSSIFVFCVSALSADAGAQTRNSMPLEQPVARGPSPYLVLS